MAYYVTPKVARSSNLSSPFYMGEPRIFFCLLLAALPRLLKDKLIFDLQNSPQLSVPVDIGRNFSLIELLRPPLPNNNYYH